MDYAPIFSKRVSAGTRVYYIDARKDKKQQTYITVSEIPLGNGRKKKRQRIFIHSEALKKVIDAISHVAMQVDEAGENVSKR